MKVSTWVHDLADAMSAGRILTPHARDEATFGRHEVIVAKARRAAPEIVRIPVFTCQFSSDDLFSEALIEHAEATDLLLPFPSMLLEIERPGMHDPDTGEIVTDRWIIHAADVGHGIGVEVATTDRDPDEWLLGYGSALIEPGHGRRFSITGYPANQFEADAENTLSDAVGLLASFLGLLHTPAVERTVVEASAKLNRRRRARGKHEIPTYTSITLRLPSRRYRHEEDGAAIRSSPRAHWRRGHLREFQPGRFAVIPPTLVAWDIGGDPVPPRFNVVRHEPHG
jgi:hypothetical protein